VSASECAASASIAAEPLSAPATALATKIAALATRAIVAVRRLWALRSGRRLRRLAWAAVSSMPSVYPRGGVSLIAPAGYAGSHAEIKASGEGGSGRASRASREGVAMADVTPLEEKLAEVIGLAQAAKEASDEVLGLLDDDGGSQTDTLRRLKSESEETAERATKVAELDGFEFLIMAEAEEEAISELVDWALPIQEEHLKTVRSGSLELAAKEEATAA
jgi:hypothetical protein